MPPVPPAGGGGLTPKSRASRASRASRTKEKQCGHDAYKEKQKAYICDRAIKKANSDKSGKSGKSGSRSSLPHTSMAILSSSSADARGIYLLR